jgi:hypothetical protein
VNRDAKCHQPERDEGAPFEENHAWVAEPDCRVAQHVDVPGDRVRIAEDAEERRQWRERIEHRAREQKHEVEDRGDGVEGIVAAHLEREDRVEEKPARGA